MMNLQVKVIPPAILKIASLFNFCNSVYNICLYALFLSYIYMYMFAFCLYLDCIIHTKKKAIIIIACDPRSTLD